MSSGVPPVDRRDPSGAHRLSAIMASLITPFRQRRTSDRHPARPASVDGSVVDSLAYQQWLHHLHRTTADAFDEDATEI